MGSQRVANGPKQLHQMPALGYDDYKRVIQRSWVHVYWTVPFILSWSLMEAMASGCCIVAPPGREMITSGDQGQLVTSWPDALAQQVDLYYKTKTSVKSWV